MYVYKCIYIYIYIYIHINLYTRFGINTFICEYIYIYISCNICYHTDMYSTYSQPRTSILWVWSFPKLCEFTQVTYGNGSKYVKTCQQLTMWGLLEKYKSRFATRLSMVYGRYIYSQLDLKTDLQLACPTLWNTIFGDMNMYLQSIWGSTGVPRF